MEPPLFSPSKLYYLAYTLPIMFTRHGKYHQRISKVSGCYLASALFICSLTFTSFIKELLQPNTQGHQLSQHLVLVTTTSSNYKPNIHDKPWSDCMQRRSMLVFISVVRKSSRICSFLERAWTCHFRSSESSS